MLTNHDNKNIPLCNNPAELLTWKHALCEEVRNWSLSLENNTRIIERQSFYLSESNETILFAKLCCLWSPRKFELHFTIVYWFKSPTWHRKSNRACAKITGKPGKQQTWRLILRWRKCTRLSRKSGYFQHWLEYSSAFEVLEAREKLNIVLSSWETFEDLRKCWPSLHESKLRLNTCCGRCSCWTSSGTESWLNQRQLKQIKSMPVICFKESFVERTVSKENSKSMQSNARNCSHVQVDFQLYNEERYSKKQKIHKV